MCPARVILIAATLLASLLTIGAVRPGCPENLDQLARQVTADDAVIRTNAVRTLRAAGPAGLAALCRANAAIIEKGPQPQGGPDTADNPAPVWQRLTSALDQVGMARDTYAAQLFWYTDLDQAKAAARAANKPILSLRLLGNLDEEYSCANSRYFRSALYANKALSAYLRDGYILHWQTVRSAPRITIDFGDGRKLERTITGNSIHYILDPDGNVIDALPGLYGPQAFLRHLQEAAPAAGRPTNPENRVAYAHQAAQRLGVAWTHDLDVLGIAIPAEVKARADAAAAPAAVQAAPVAMSKLGGERKLLAQLFPASQIQAITDAAGWSKLAALHREDACLDAASLRLMCQKSPLLRAQSAEPSSSGMVSAFADSMALDTVRNEYLLRRTILDWLARDGGQTQLDGLNRRIYAELFLTPDSDPWLGLLPRDTYTALENDGVCAPRCR
jgi:hypothetical protein